jgi:hypothetical protein
MGIAAADGWAGALKMPAAVGAAAGAAGCSGAAWVVVVVVAVVVVVPSLPPHAIANASAIASATNVIGRKPTEIALMVPSLTKVD